jgi:oxysterol-binding protein-related protein 8
MFFDATKSKPSPPLVRPIDDQEERESQRLWAPTAQAVKDRNHELATDEKTKIEDQQREEAARRASEGVEWRPRLFRRVKGGPGGPEEGEEDLEWIINAKMHVPPRFLHIGYEANVRSRDADTPEKQAEQIMAIFPIVKGQKPNQANAIPPRGSVSAPSEQPVPPTEAKGGNDDLIDFGQNEAPASQEPAAQATKAPAEKNDVEGMLKATGKEAADGPLIDFHEDMKKNIPVLKRSTTEGSDEIEFHDAEG